MTYEQFYKKWQGHEIEDTGSYNSQEALQFAKELKSVLNAEFGKKDLTLIRYHVGHYAVSGFVVREHSYGYFSYSFPRHMPVNLTVGGVNGFLYRTVNGLSDYTGGYNNYTDLEHLADEMDRLLMRSERGDT